MQTFNTRDLAVVDPETGMAGWQTAVGNAVRNPGTIIHIALDGMAGATPAERFMNSYQAGRSGTFGATDWEMARVGRAVRLGDRSWGTIKFYLAANESIWQSPAGR